LRSESGRRGGQGLFWFNALYQGRPVIDGAGIFKRPSFLYYEATRRTTARCTTPCTGGTGNQAVRSAECFRFQTIDLAASVKTSADFTVISTWDVTKEHDLMLVDRLRTRMESPDHAPMVEAEFLKKKATFIGVEKATYGIAMMQVLLRSGRPIRKLEPDKDKVSRAIPAGDAVDNGKVYFPKHVTWLEEWESELVAFDNGTHDDQVDTLAYAVLVMQGLPHFRPPKPPEDRSPEARIEKRIQAMEKKHRKRRAVVPTLGRW
jgi:predicted phage terminase large subunit-like protein